MVSKKKIHVEKVKLKTMPKKFKIHDFLSTIFKMEISNNKFPYNFVLIINTFKVC